MKLPNRINQPPKAADRMLGYFCKGELLEEILGDLYEYYVDMEEHPGWKRKLFYWFHVFNFLRPFALKNSRFKNSNIYDMYKNYFKIGYRNIIRNKGYSAINIGGLALGLTVAMFIGLWIYDELSFDTYHANYDKIGRVRQNITLNGMVEVGPATSMPVGPALHEEYGDDLIASAYASWAMDYNLSFGDKTMKTMGNYMGKETIRMFTLPMLHGDENALAELNSIVLTSSLAQSIFGDIDPMDKVLKINNKLSVKVTGVFEDLPKNSSLSGVNFIAPFELFVSDQEWVQNAIKEKSWGNNSFQLFVQLADHIGFDEFNKKIEKLMYNHITEEHRAYNPKVVAYPMKDWHLRSSWVNGVQSGGAIQYVWMFGIIGLFVLVLACINFMNLSTAQAEKRAKEVGIRKTMGSLRNQLVGQFLSESFLIVFIGYLIANVMVQLSLPFFNDLSEKQVSIPYTNPIFWLVSLTFLLITALLSGSYPSFYLSSFDVVRVVKGTFKSGRSSAYFRRGLVVLQFTISIALIIGSVMVQKQINHTKNRPVGYDRSGTLMVYQGAPDFEGKFEVIRTALKDKGIITEMAQSFSPPTGVWSNTSDIKWEGKDPSFQSNFASIHISHEFGNTINWNVKEGRDLSRSFATDTAAMMINEAAVAYMNMDNPVGQLLEWPGGGKFRIVGVVEDMLMESPFQEVRPTVFYTSPGQPFNWYVIKLHPQLNLSNALAQTEGVFREIMPAVPFDYQFVDREHAKKFAYEERIGKIAGIFAVFAVVISCLGLFGLSSYVAEQKTKEIGIRKVLGASILQLWRMMSGEFVKLVIISCIISIPLAYYFVDDWLANYEYRTIISWWVLVLAIGAALGVTIFTVSFQSIRTARMNPSKSLRSE